MIRRSNGVSVGEDLHGIIEKRSGGRNFVIHELFTIFPNNEKRFGSLGNVRRVHVKSLQRRPKYLNSNLCAEEVSSNTLAETDSGSGFCR